jgi:hypothetical protein
MKQIILFFLMCVFFLSCESPKQVEQVESKPEWVIEEEKMIDVIIDLRIVDAATYINTNLPPRNKVKDWEFVMNKHQIVDSIFTKSHDYYAGHPKVLSSIYEKVIDKLSEMQTDNYEKE